MDQDRHDVLKRFIKVQKKVESYNSYGTFEGLQICDEEVDSLTHFKKQSERDYRVLTEQANLQKKDFDNISGKSFEVYFKNKEDHIKMIEKEKKKYEKSLDLVKISVQELTTIQKKYNSALEQSDDFHKKNKRAIDLLNEQIHILNTFFDGENGSDLENQLEDDLNLVEKEKTKLKSAINRWNNARFLLVYACNQIQEAETKWKDLMKFDLDDPKKVLWATQTINNLISCHSNLEKLTTQLLKNVKFPFCKPNEMTSMILLTDTIFKDMETKETQKKTIKSIEELRKSCISLKLWLDSVIKDTLMKPYADAVNNANRITQELTSERIRLLKDLIKETFGEDVNLDTLDKLNTEKNDHYLDNMKDEAENDEQNLRSDVVISEQNAVDNFQLPPPPSKEQLLGDVEVLKKEYREQTDGWNKKLEDSRNEADAKLKKMLESFNTKIGPQTSYEP